MASYGLPALKLASVYTQDSYNTGVSGTAATARGARRWKGRKVSQGQPQARGRRVKKPEKENSVTSYPVSSGPSNNLFPSNSGSSNKLVPHPPADNSESASPRKHGLGDAEYAANSQSGRVAHASIWKPPAKAQPEEAEEEDEKAGTGFFTHRPGDKNAGNKNRTESGANDASADGKVADALTPAMTIKLHSDSLTPFEMSEVLTQSQVYYVGASAKKDKVKGVPHAPQNNGYDDERGDYTIIQHDHIGYRYEVLSVLGKGSFGQVVKVLDHKDGSFQALKLIRNKKRFHHQALVEVKVLEHLMTQAGDRDANIVRMYRYFYFRNHLCITFELLSLNLYEFIKANKFRGFKLTLIRKIAVQLLQSLTFLQKERIIHCDLKPENVLLISPSNSAVRLIDFGSSCFSTECVYTYIQSRFYRAPEIVLGLSYDLAIDMWSFGCILAELYTGYPIFPGEDEKEQIQCMMEILGVPPEDLLRKAQRTRKFFDGSYRPLVVPNSRGRVRHANAKTLSSAVKCADSSFLDFLRLCFEWDPRLRLTPDAAMGHPFISQEEPAATQSTSKRSTRSSGRKHYFPPLGQSSARKPAGSSTHSLQNHKIPPQPAHGAAAYRKNWLPVVNTNFASYNKN